MAAVEEAASSGNLLNGDLDPDDREEGAACTAEEAAKKKRRKKKKSKGVATGKGELYVVFFQGWPNDLAGSGPAWMTGTGDSEPWTALSVWRGRANRVSAPGGEAASRPVGLESWWKRGEGEEGRSASLGQLWGR